MPVLGLARRLGKAERLPFGGEGYWRRLAVSRQGHVAYMHHVVSADIRRQELAGSRWDESLPMNSTRLDHVPQYSYKLASGLPYPSRWRRVGAV